MKTLFTVFVVLILAFSIFAQDTPSTPAASTTPLFTTSSDAVALSIGGQTVAATDIAASLAVTDHFLLQEHNILSPANDGQFYFGAGRYNTQLANLLKNTKLPQNTFLFYAHGGAGIVRIVPSTGPNHQHFSAFGGVGIDYDPTHTGKFTVKPVQVDYLNAPGFGRSPHGWMISSGISVALSK